MSHTQLHREYITSSEMYSLHLTHPKWTNTRSSGQPCYSARGAVGGSVPCSRTPQSWYWRRILPPPTIPAGPEIQTHNLPLTSPTRYPLGHDCPIYYYITTSIIYYYTWQFKRYFWSWSLYSINLNYFQPVELLWSPSGRLNSIGETFVPFFGHWHSTYTALVDLPMTTIPHSCIGIITSA